MHGLSTLASPKKIRYKSATFSNRLGFRIGEDVLNIDWLLSSQLAEQTERKACADDEVKPEVLPTW